MKKTIPQAVKKTAKTPRNALTRHPAEFAAFHQYPAGTVRPAGYLREFIKRQIAGTTGNRHKLGYPFNLRLWEGPMDEIYFTEGVYNGSDQKKEGTKEEFWASGSWWPFEQSAYLLDGMARLASMYPAPQIEREYAKSFNWVFKHPAENGDLFTPLSNSGTQWPLVVFARSAWAYAEKHGLESQVAAAFQKHYDAHRADRAAWKDRDMLSAECMLRTMEYTGDRSLLTDALTAYRNSSYYRQFGVKQRIFDHGVSFSEALKLPALLYMYSGDRSILERGERAVADAFAINEQADGQVSSNEYLSGRDPRQGHETCVATDMTWALGYYILANGNVSAADHIEKIIYNALPGACTKDFRLHQYLSSVNQAFCTPFSQSAHFNYGEATWRQYRVAHFPQCCTGNINRAMPNYVARLWLQDARTGAPAKFLYGPSILNAEYRGVEFTLEEKDGGYPFADRATIVYHGQDLEMPLTYRIPSWCARPDAGKVLVEKRVWHDGDTFVIELPSQVTLKSDRHWHWFERGPLTFTYAVPSEIVKENPRDPFGALRITPNGAWNFAFDLPELAKKKLTAEFTPSAYPFEKPALTLEVPVAEIKEWQVADHNRFMPDPPLFTHLTGKKTTITLVPFATTLGRITCFPDTARREELPVVAAYTAPEAYPYDAQKPLREQIFPPEKWTDLQFRNLYKVPQREPDVYFNLYDRYGYGESEPRLAYMLFRFWSDRAGEATFALGAASVAQALINGKTVYESLPFTEAVMMAPFWFTHAVRKGYNYLLVKCATPGGRIGQFRREWGAKLQVFMKK